MSGHLWRAEVVLNLSQNIDLYSETDWLIWAYPNKKDRHKGSDWDLADWGSSREGYRCLVIFQNLPSKKLRPSFRNPDIILRFGNLWRFLVFSDKLEWVGDESGGPRKHLLLYPITCNFWADSSDSFDRLPLILIQNVPNTSWRYDKKLVICSYGFLRKNFDRKNHH